ncbi:UPF0042 nucleotide-binding protein [Williamsia serinedens]|uniref:UPF0042 nucleotide-binding protein n=2 Tax=Williamsia serinedens TaxID=391736 RepID=A0ABT1GW61_9NOCA|nr:RNase adapter RapZ [Williamsia serinedens]MCP2159195.1 UPF0042 nucleotide-binding protein [Williamsia serinedens]
MSDDTRDAQGMLLEDGAGRDLDVLLVTGMSGAGRGTVARLLEDLGWYVTDNVPSPLIPRTVIVARQETPDTNRVAVVMRTPTAAFAAGVSDVRSDLESTGAAVRLLFLDADDAALVRRYEQVRRRHPFQQDGTLVDAIARERAALAGVSESADLAVDTSGLSVTALRTIVDNAFAQPSGTDVRITVQSFGFKYGLPIDADLVADVRFLPNPYWVAELRDLTGRDDPVSTYVLGQPGADAWLEAYERIVRLTAEGYTREGKRYMTVAIGCTGGKHRSVAMSTELARRLCAPAADTTWPGADRADLTPFDARAVHRDLGRE